jgi:transposase InsO family protein
MESFNARLREEYLNREELWTLTEARVVIEDWRWKYNHVRPHRSLGYIKPNEFLHRMKVEKRQRVNAVHWVGLRPPRVPALTYSTTLSK